MRRRDYSYLESDVESDYSLDILRESLRDERNALNDAIKEADREYVLCFVYNNPLSAESQYLRFVIPGFWQFCGS